MIALQRIGIAIIQSLQTLSPTLDVPMKLFSFLGTIEFYMVLLPLIYWLIDSRLGIRALVLLIGVATGTDFFKQLLRQPRPYWLGSVRGIASGSEYGVPSGHSSGSMAVWGYLAYRVKRGWMWVVAIILVVAIGFSRMYLGVHFPHDVVAGWTLGLILIVLFVQGERLGQPWVEKQTPAVQIVLAFGASLGVLLAGIVVRQITAGTADPEAWRQFAVDARSLTYYFTSGGALFGALSGYVLMRQWAPFKASDSWAKKAGCLVAGLVGMLVLRYGLDALFGLIAIDESVLGYILRYVRYTAITFWVAFGAPYIFLRLRLAEPAD